MKPSDNDINNALANIARASGERPPFDARKAVANHRARRARPQLTQAQIDSGSETEERRRRFVSASVKWSKRSLWARLFRWR